jgi:hypothetical protein
MLRRIFIICVAISLLQACQVQKRHYMKGYYVSKSETNKTEKKVITSNTSTKLIEAVEQVQLLATTDQGPLAITDPIINADCDTIIDLKGNKMGVKVVEDTPTTITYKDCMGTTERKNTVSKTLIKEIRYRNGIIEKIDQNSLRTQTTFEEAAQANTTKIDQNDNNDLTRIFLFYVLSSAVGIILCYAALKINSGFLLGLGVVFIIIGVIAFYWWLITGLKRKFSKNKE